MRKGTSVCFGATAKQTSAGGSSACKWKIRRRGTSGVRHPDGIQGQERSTGLPLDEEMISQLAMEAEIRGMRLGSSLPRSFSGSSRRTFSS